MLHTLNPTILRTDTSILALTLIYTGISTSGKITWLMKVTPVIIVILLLLITMRQCPLTPLLYTLIFLHAITLVMNGIYTYAKVPVGFQVQEWLGLSRNPYGELSHLFQGLVPALTAKEILVRGDIVRGHRMLTSLAYCIALAISTMYELVEWRVILTMGQGVDGFLSMQDNPWGTQSGMFCALLDALTTILALAGWHDRQLKTAGEC